MLEDPRLRLLGANPDLTQAAAALAALDDTAIDIRIGTEVTGTARVAAAALAGMCARLFGAVTIIGPGALPPNWWDSPTIGSLVERISDLTPSSVTPPRRRLTVTVGAEGIQQGDLGVGGGDYLVAVGRGRMPVTSRDHALGVHGAGCLAVGQLLGRALDGLGLRVVAVEQDYRLDLITHRQIPPADTALSPVNWEAGPDPFELVMAGAGSVGSSAVALLATTLAPEYTGRPAPSGLSVAVVDVDRFDPGRNPFRYPALTGGETGFKATELATRLRLAGLSAVGAATTVGTWVQQRDQPGVRGLLVSSVDTLAGRLQVADALAEQTLSIGVSGLALHAQRERFGGSTACPFCDYVVAAPPLTQAEVYVRTVGLDVGRVLALLQPGAVLTEADVAQAVAAGKVPEARRAVLVGRTLTDLVRQAYAEVALRAPSMRADGTVTLASPHVSWFAGVLAAVEIVKQLRGLPLLDTRVDADLAGLPPGIVRRIPPDSTGRCVCRSGVRQRWYRTLYGAA